MNKLNEVKLAIYEKCNKGEITNDECKILLEKAEERYAFDADLTEDEKIAVECVMDGSMTVEEVLDLDDSDDEIVEESGSIEKKVNKVADEASDALKRHTQTVKIMKEAKNQYRENEKNIKSLIKEKKYQEAKKAIGKCESSVKVIKSSIESIKDEPSDAVIDFVFNTGKFFALDTLTGVILTSLGKFDVQVGDVTVRPNVSIKRTLIGGAEDAAVYSAYKKVTKGTWNTTRANAIKALNKQLMALKRLSNKVDKLSSKK